MRARSAFASHPLLCLLPLIHSLLRMHVASHTRPLRSAHALPLTSRTACFRYHFVCAMYPAPEQCPRSWRLENQLFVCRNCAPSAPLKGKLAVQRLKLFKLQTRRAAELPTCALSDSIEAHLASELASKVVTTPTPLVVRVVSRKRFIFPAEKVLQERYGSAYAAEVGPSRD